LRSYPSVDLILSNVAFRQRAPNLLVKAAAESAALGTLERFGDIVVP
jgi:hypothetical protein